MKPEKGRGSEMGGEMEADQVDMETEELAKWVGLMVLEARGPGRAKCQEGPHCPNPQTKGARPTHTCGSNKSWECRRAEDLRKQVVKSLKNHMPIYIDVVLFPPCCHGRMQAESLDQKYFLDKEPAILLERWTISVDQKRHMGEKVEGVGSTFGLMSAVRSQLYFSQLSSWIQTHSDGLPLSVAYRVFAPGENGPMEFVETPVIRTLPVVDLKNSFLRVSVSELPRKEDNSIILLQCAANSVTQTPDVSSLKGRQWKEYEDKPTIPEGAMSHEWPLPGRTGSAAAPRSQLSVKSQPMSFLQDGAGGIRLRGRSPFVPGDIAQRCPDGATVKHRMRQDLTSPLENLPSAGRKVPRGSSTVKHLYSPNVLVTSDQDGVVTQFERLLPDASYCLGSLEMTQSTKAGLLVDDDTAFPSSNACFGASPWEPHKKSPFPHCPSPKQDTQSWMNQQGSNLYPPQFPMKPKSIDAKLERMRKIKVIQKHPEMDYEGDAEDGIAPSEDHEGIDIYLGDEDLPQRQSQTSNPMAWDSPTWNMNPINSSMDTPQQNSCTDDANQSGNKTSSGGKKKRTRRKKRGRREEPEQKDRPSILEEKLQSKPFPASPMMQREEKHPQERKPPDFRTDEAPPHRFERISRKDIPRNFPDSLPHSRNMGASYRNQRKNLRDLRLQERRFWYKSKEAEHLQECINCHHSQDSKRRKSTSSELEPERWQKLKQERPLDLASTPPIQQQPASQTERPQESAQNIETPRDGLVSVLVEAMHSVVTVDLMKKDEKVDDDDEESELSSMDEDSDIEAICHHAFQTIEANAPRPSSSAMSSEETAKTRQKTGEGFNESQVKESKGASHEGPLAENDSNQQLEQTAQSASLRYMSALIEYGKPSSWSEISSHREKICGLKNDPWEPLWSPRPAQLPRLPLASLDFDSSLWRMPSSRSRDSHSNIPEFNKDSAVCLQPLDVRTVAGADSEQERTDSNLSDAFNQCLHFVDGGERKTGVEWTTDREAVTRNRKLQQAGYQSRDTQSPSSSTSKRTEEVSSTAKSLLRNEPVSFGTSNGFAADLDAGTNSVSSEKRVSARESEVGISNLMQKSQQIKTSSQDAVEGSHREFWAKLFPTENSHPSTKSISTERGEAEDLTVTLTSQEKPLRQKEEAFECACPEYQEILRLKSDYDPVSLNSSLETLVGSLPKGDHSADAKEGISRATFYEPDSTEDGDLLSGLTSTVCGEFTTKDDLSALFLAKRMHGKFGNDGEVSDEVFAKSSPPSPVKPGPGREEDVLLRSSPSQGGRTNLKRPRSESSKLPEVLSAVEACAHRQHLRKSHSLIFNGRTALPSQSSPAPVKRKSMNNFGFVDGLTKPRAISSALSCSRLASDDDQEEGEDNTRTLSTSAPASTNCLLGNFEESVLNGRIEPMGIVEGFTAEIGASGSFCPKHKTMPVTAYFFKLSDDNAPSPYLGHINLQTLGKKGYHVPKKGTVQVTLFNPSKTVVKMFVVMYDLSEMPPHCQTFLRQRTLYQPVDRNSNEPSYLRYLIHLRFASSGSGRVYLHTDIRLIFARDKFELDSKVSQYELRSFTECPQNPKFSRRR